MTATITANNGAGVATPLTVLSPWQTSWAGRSVIHDLLDGSMVVSVVVPRLRAGTYSALFEAEADAFACAELHRQPTTFTLAESERPYVSMTYAVAGQIDVQLDPDTLDLWLVTIGYQATA